MLVYIAKQLEEGAAGGGGGGADEGYIDWLKKQMMRSSAGMDEDEINWKFAVDNKQVGNSFLHAEAEEKAAQQKYGAILSDMDLYNRLVGLLKNNPALDALKAVSEAADDPEMVKPARKRAVLAVAAATSGPTSGSPFLLKDDPKYSKYFKMLKMHLPPPAVKQKMTAEGLDPAILDMDPEALSPNSPKPSAGGGGPVLLLKDDPKYSKYFKMLKMHLPPPAVKQKMSAEGLDPNVLDMDPESPSPNQPAAVAGGGGPVLLLKDDEKYSKYFKMLKMHLPPPAVKQKMSAEGLDPNVLDMDPEGPSPNQPAAAAAPAAAAEEEAAPSMEGLDMFAQIRMAKELKAKKLAAGGGGGGKGNMKTALKKVEKVLNGPRGAKEELAKLTCVWRTHPRVSLDIQTRTKSTKSTKHCLNICLLTFFVFVCIEQLPAVTRAPRLMW